MNFGYSLSSVPKPVFVFTPLHESHIQAAVICLKQLGVHLRIRSGGHAHDYEGVSYALTINDCPFVVLDRAKLRPVSVDLKDETAVGEFYYKIAAKSNVHSFPAGILPV